MKKLYSIFALFLFINSYSQYNLNAPWNTSGDAKSKKSNRFSESVSRFDEYWKDKDFSKKGSGHKPFKRWENHWENSLNEDGTIAASGEIWTIWQQKNKLKSNKKANSNFSLPSSNWTPVGPFSHTNTGSWSSGQGRVNVVCVDPSNSNTIYVGSPAGGIWKSVDNGNKWTPLSDNLPQIGVSGIAVDPTNSNTIYIATGDKDSQDTYSIGVLKSTDGGITWNTTGLSFSNTSTLCGDLIIHPTDNQILFCATSIGLFKTSNGGSTWTNVEANSYSSGSIRFKPNNPTTVYAVSSSAFFVSRNTGASFARISNGLPASSLRLVLDVTANDPNYVYILSASASGSFQGVYRSINSGINWTKTLYTGDIFDKSKQAYYDLALAVSQTDKNEIYTGVLNVWKSVNGGDNFTKVNNWSSPTSAAYTHADIHFLKFYGNKLFCGSDGGIYVSSNNGSAFTDLTSGLQISQFYKISVSKQTSSKLVGGLQDNGGHAYSGGLWKNYYGADGMDTSIDPNNSNKYYGFIQYGGGLYISSTAGNSLGLEVAAPSDEVLAPNDSGGNWVTPLVVNKIGEVFSGYSKLYKLDDTNWNPQSTSTIGDSTNNIELITIDPSNDNVMFVINGNRLYKSTNKGIDFTNSYTATRNITSISVNYSNSNIIYITTSGTSGQTLKSTNGGTTFTSFSEGLPAISKKVIKHQGRNSLNPLFLGTSLGVYYRDDTMLQWEPFDTNLPNVEVTDLEINLEDSIITAATYGRGIWQSPIAIEIPLNDIKLVTIQNPTININCGSVSPEIEVKNNGTNSISAVNVNYDFNGSPLNFIWNGTIASGNSQVINLPDFTATTKGVFSLNINTTIANDAYSDNNMLSTAFYVNDLGTIGTLNTFETATENLLAYTSGTTTSLWQKGISTNGLIATPNNTIYSTNFTGNYPNNSKAYLFSQCYNLTNVINPQVKFKMQFDLEQNWDVVYLEYTTNMGLTWNVLGTQGANWYNSNRTNTSSGTANDCQNCPGAQWTGTNTTMTDYSYPLNSLIGQSNVVFRIVFHSDESENKLGVNIDNFVIEGTPTSQDFELKDIAIYPNPSAGIFTISSGNKAIDTIEVYDFTGKRVVSLKNVNATNSTTVLDLTTVSNGLYFIRIASENQSIVKQIIKN